MSSIREAIREQSRLSRMRMGQEVGEYVEIPSMPEIRMLQVPLTERETADGLIRGAEINVPDNVSGILARERAVKQSDVWHSLRIIGEPGKKVFSSIDDMTGEDGLEPEDIDHLHENLAVLMSYASPGLDDVTVDDWNDLKKAFNEIDLNALSGRQWAALKLAFQHLFPHILRAKSLGLLSTEASTTTSENGESI
jgi:hypothetical protein